MHVRSHNNIIVHVLPDSAPTDRTYVHNTTLASRLHARVVLSVRRVLRLYIARTEESSFVALVTV